MIRYHYREGVTLEKKKRRWLLLLVSVIIMAIAAYVAAIYLAPQLVTIPFTSLTADATDIKIKTSQPGQFGDRLFIPQINVDIEITSGAGAGQPQEAAWQRHPDLGNPEKGGNFALSARKFSLDVTPQLTRAKSPFYNLGKLKAGDELTVDFQGKRYAYRVERIDSSNTEAHPEQKADGYWLTLYATDGTGNAIAGPVVSAVRIGPPAEQVTAFGGP